MGRQGFLACWCVCVCVANWRDVDFIDGIQACQLLKLLCKELGVDFEIFAESFLPVSPAVPLLLLFVYAG